MLKATLGRLFQGEDLSAEAMREAMGGIMDGEATPAQIGAFLAALRLKGETVDEVVGGVQAMRARMVRVPVAAPEKTVDTCGTGGDGAGTFNISTAAAFVVAGAGAPVAKHGNRSVSSRSGSADVLAAIGVDPMADLEAETLGALIDGVGIAFLMAPRHHPAMKHAIGPRRELGQRTIFNLLGPLTNPAGALNQVVGVFSASWCRPLAEALGRLGSRHVWVVHGEDGLDELSLCAPTRVAEWRDGALNERVLSPGDFGLNEAPAEALLGGGPEENAATLRKILDGATGPITDAVLMNAAAALHVAGVAPGPLEGVALAKESIASGAAAGCLAKLAAATQEGQG